MASVKRRMLAAGLPVSAAEVNPWSMALSTPGALKVIRQRLKEKDLTDAQIDRVLVDVSRLDEINLSGVGPTILYESPQAIAEFTGQKPSTKPLGDIRVDVDVTPLEIQIPDITLAQGVAQEITPIQLVPTKPDKPTASPKPGPKKKGGDEEPLPPGEPVPPTPPVPKKKGDPGRRPNVLRALVGGLKEGYTVKFDYPKGKSESFTVTARSFPQALSQATQLRRVKYVPSEVDIAKRGK